MTTVVACRSLGIMVADSRISHGEGKFRSRKKVQRAGKYLVGISGDYMPGLAFMRSFIEAVKRRSSKAPPMLPRTTGEFEMLALSCHGLWMYGKDGTPVEIEDDDVYSIGSGGLYARAALRAQELAAVERNLAQAVEVACEYDDASELPVVLMALRSEAIAEVLTPANPHE